jgi:hypothetical protein
VTWAEAGRCFRHNVRLRSSAETCAGWRTPHAVYVVLTWSSRDRTIGHFACMRAQRPWPGVNRCWTRTSGAMRGRLDLRHLRCHPVGVIYKSRPPVRHGANRTMNSGRFAGLVVEPFVVGSPLQTVSPSSARWGPNCAFCSQCRRIQSNDHPPDEPAAGRLKAANWCCGSGMSRESVSLDIRMRSRAVQTSSDMAREEQRSTRLTAVARRDIPKAFGVYSEWMVARHSMLYTRLHDPPIAFDLYDRLKGIFLCVWSTRAYWRDLKSA